MNDQSARLCTCSEVMCTFYIPLWPGCLHTHLALFLPSGGDSEEHEDEEVHHKCPATNGAD